MITRRQAEEKAYAKYTKLWEQHKRMPEPQINVMDEVVQARKVWLRFFNEIGDGKPGDELAAWQCSGCGCLLLTEAEYCGQCQGDL